MRNMTTRIQTANYTRITQTYLAEVIEPVTRSFETRTPRVLRYRVGDVPISLMCYSPLLAEHFARALEHLPAPATSEEDLTVYVWDTVETGVEMPSPWSDPRFFSLGTNARQDGEKSGFTGVYVHYDDTLTLYDPANRRAYFWTYDASRLQVWLRAAPLRTLFQWVLGERGIHLIHGAVVSDGDKAVLLTAKGGSGKSTTALSCLRAGMQYLADDYVGVSEGDPPRAYSLYNSIKVAPYQGSGFDPAHISLTEGEKSIVFLSRAFPNQMAYSSTLKAILIPSVANQEQTTIAPASKAEAMLALIPTTLFQLPLAESTKVSQLTRIISTLPCFKVGLGTDGDEVAQAIRRFVNDHL